MLQPSAFQELMKLVRDNLHLRSDEDAFALLRSLQGMRQAFENDRDLLESVILRVEQHLKGRS
jgi:hypothetical protein